MNGCAYAYGRTGHIVDLRDPANPVLLPSRPGAQAVGYGNRANAPYTHDLTEIRPGLVMSAGSTAILMDTRDPAAPVELTRIDPGRPASPAWATTPSSGPAAGRDPWLVVGTEIARVPARPTARAATARARSR